MVELCLIFENAAMKMLLMDKYVYYYEYFFLI